jgi:methionine synthase II (cobalamin-independent)
LRRIEDTHIRDAVKRQEAAGLKSITDGEFRRAYLYADFLKRLQGVTLSGGITITFHTESGELNFAPPRVSVTASCDRDEIDSLYRAGCRYIQFDDVNLAYLCDPKLRAGAKERGKTVVLGLVSSKVAQVETSQSVIQRIKDAARYMPLEQMCLSPQCGFASTEHGNEITEAIQWAKIELVLNVAKQVWGN